MKNILLIDLTTFSTIEEISIFLDNINMNDSCKESFIYDINDDSDNVIENESRSNYLWRWKMAVDRIWVSYSFINGRLNSFDIISYIDKKGCCNFTEEYGKYLCNITPVGKGDFSIPENISYKLSETTTDEYDTDKLLDKINSFGIKSLTDKEREFLDKN